MYLKLFVILSLCSFSWTLSKDKEELISNFLNNLRDGNVIKYNLYFKATYPTGGTHEFDNKCIVKISDKDTITGGYYNITTIFLKENKDTTISEMIYNGKEYLSYSPDYLGIGNVEYLLRNKDKEEFKDKLSENKMYTILSIPKRSGLHNVSIYTLKSNFMKKDIVDSYKLDNDTNINGISYFQLSNEKANKRTLILFDKKTYFPTYYRYEYNSYVSECFYSNYLVNPKIGKYTFSKKYFPNSFTFKPNYPRESTYLKTNDTAPIFEIQTIFNNSYKSTDIKESLRLLYFSEINCYGCILAIPEVKELQNNYKQLKVLGIYTRDSKESLIKYCKEKEVVFDVCAKAKNLGDKFGVNAYPTFFLVDKNNKIIYSTEGYFKTLKAELVKEIENWTKNNP